MILGIKNTVLCQVCTIVPALHLELRSVTCNGAEENQAHRCEMTKKTPDDDICAFTNDFNILK